MNIDNHNHILASKEWVRFARRNSLPFIGSTNPGWQGLDTITLQITPDGKIAWQATKLTPQVQK